MDSKRTKNLKKEGRDSQRKKELAAYFSGQTIRSSSVQRGQSLYSSINQEKQLAY